MLLQVRTNPTDNKPDHGFRRRGSFRMIGTPTLCIDVDSTIWDTGAWVCTAVLEVTGEELDVEEVSTWTYVLDTYGEETTTLVFDRVFDPARIRKREPYPGAPEALRALREDFDIGIHFVTHNDPRP
jgi:5'(3')-deoxyribonucleotidase